MLNVSKFSLFCFFDLVILIITIAVIASELQPSALPTTTATHHRNPVPETKQKEKSERK
jgi:hypothetical protein